MQEWVISLTLGFIARRKSVSSDGYYESVYLSIYAQRINCEVYVRSVWHKQLDNSLPTIYFKTILIYSKNSLVRNCHFILFRSTPILESLAYRDKIKYFKLRLVYPVTNILERDVKREQRLGLPHWNRVQTLNVYTVVFYENLRKLAKLIPSIPEHQIRF